MKLETSLFGRLRNTSLSKNHDLMPLFETVVNSIQSIEERSIDVLDGQITVFINRSEQETLEFGKEEVKSILGFTIIENGCGFNEKIFKGKENIRSRKIE